ncbi:MAG: mannose-1-phosphate guanyltransferase [Chlorobiaceae bacterium]|nr:mannose-1-phosphate guanyltransferase [Chlorobiaceae bacterium]
MSNGSGNHVFAVIMAGGIGRNLWPESRKKIPKQFLDLFDEGTMIAKTVQRIKGSVNEENILVVTGENGSQLLSSSSCGIRPENIIVEPVSRNTAPCIALATAHIKKRDPDAITVVLPSDHLVLDDGAFIKMVDAAIAIARETKGLVTIGVTADRPETVYGYIQAEEELPLSHSLTEGYDFKLFKVKAFAEKPDYTTAIHFLESRDFYWNSGVFIWHIDAISLAFERSMPDLYKDLLNIYHHLGTPDEKKVIEDVYSWIHPVSIDYGVMEKAAEVFVLTGEFGWTDLGCWDEVMKVAGSRVVMDAAEPERSLVQIDCENLYIRKPAGKLVCTIGLSDVIIVDTADALLVCNKGCSHRVEEVADLLRREGLQEYL